MNEPKKISPGVTSEAKKLTTEAEWLDAYRILKAFRPSLELGDLLDSREKLLGQGYQLIGLFQERKLVAVAGILILPHILRGTELRVQDLATDPECRSQGFGSQLLQQIENIAEAEGCSRVLLYSQNKNARAHKFYRENKFQDYGVEFAKEIDAR